MNVIAGVAFDFDGTLVQSNEIKRQTYYHVAQEANCPVEIVDCVLGAETQGDRHHVITLIAAEMEQRNLLPAGENTAQCSQGLIARYSDLCETRIAACPELPGASEALKELDNLGLKLFLNSATPLNYLNKILPHRSFAGHISAVYGGPATKVENLKAITRNLGCSHSEVLVVGDGEDDLRAARQSGCQFVGVLGGKGDFAADEIPTISDLRQLVPLVADRSGRKEQAPR